MIDKYTVKQEIGKALTCVSPLTATEFLYWRNFKREVDLLNPETLNEKVSWLKLNTYAKSRLVSLCADKYEVRRYITCMGYPDILNDLYGVWDSVSEIRPEALPKSFVLKCNHGCGFNVLCEDKNALDWHRTKQSLQKWMRTDYWKLNAEMQYRGIQPRIICEKYLETNHDVPSDYKIYCFNGKPQYILVCVRRSSGAPEFYFFDRDWNFCPITHDGKNKPEGFTLPKPKCFDKMLECAEKLSAPFPFVRTDFYEVKGKLIFGELTFTPSAGMDTARLPEVDEAFGKMVDLRNAVVDEYNTIYEACCRTEIALTPV